MAQALKLRNGCSIIRISLDSDGYGVVLAFWKERQEYVVWVAQLCSMTESGNIVCSEGNHYGKLKDAQKRFWILAQTLV